MSVHMIHDKLITGVRARQLSYALPCSQSQTSSIFPSEIKADYRQIVQHQKKYAPTHLRWRKLKNIDVYVKKLVSICRVTNSPQEFIMIFQNLY